MRITDINTTAQISSAHGLQPIRMHRLGGIVVFAGKNGSGKTRLLNHIHALAQERPIHEDYASTKPELIALQKNLQENPSGPAVENWKRKIKGWQLLVNQYEALTTTADFNKDGLLFFVPKVTNLIDCNELSKADKDQSASQTEMLGISHLSKGAFSRIQVVQDTWWNVTHQGFDGSDSERDAAISSYKKLDDLIFKFLHTRLTRSRSGDAQLFGFRLGGSRLSEGQRILLQLCIAIHSQDTKLNDLILILDEPENHLHPAALVDFVDALKAFLTNGQLFIATHALSLLAHFDPSTIWYVDAGQVQYAGKIPEIVLSSLVGDENEISKLRDFLNIPAQYASLKFSAECLTPPMAVETGPDDPQVMQIREFLWAKRRGEKLRVIDFGAGKGRLLASIAESVAESSQLRDWLDYRAFDPDTTNAPICKQHIQTIYGSDEKQYFNQESDLKASIDPKSVDVVVMCNVLHEIDPNQWLNLFREEGLILTALKEDGVLLLVEAQQLPTGEKAYRNGFMVLDAAELKTLFSILESDKEFLSLDARGDGQLKAHVIPRNVLTRITAASRQATIENLCRHAEDQIRQLRRKEGSYRNGHLHGFWVQQFANARLLLSEWSNSRTT